jgi:ABC-type sugar transport system substrate-binding protein
MRHLLTAALAALLLAAGAGQAAQEKAVKVLIITGDHGHDWRRTTPFLKELLEKAGHRVDVTEAPGKDLTAENLAR